MGMGWHTLAHPYEETLSTRPCKCGAGIVKEIKVTEEESDYLPFERGYTYTKVECPNKCE